MSLAAPSFLRKRPDHRIPGATGGNGGPASAPATFRPENVGLALVAQDVFAHNASTHLPDYTDWESALRAYIEPVADSAVATGALIDHLRPGDGRTAWFPLVDRVIGLLTAAGLSDTDAMRTIAVGTNAAVAFAKDTVQARSGRRPRRDQLVVLDQRADATHLVQLSRVAADAPDTYTDQQLDFIIDTLVRATSTRLDPA